MAKKKNNQPTSTISRLATTVKVDVPNAIGATVKKQATMLSRLVPFGGTPEMKAERKLRKIAKQAAKVNSPMKPRRRRSRLPFFVAILVALIGGGGYWASQKVSMPEIAVGKYLDFDQWMKKVSGLELPHGQKPKHVETTTVASEPKAEPVQKVVTKKAEPKKPVETKKTAAVTKTSKAGKTTASTKASKKKSGKEKAWEKKLAKLQKQGDAKYRKASARYKGE